MSREILFPLFQYILADDGNRTGKCVPDGTNKGGGGGVNMGNQIRQSGAIC